ncbi:MAG: hypothetical protein A3G34_03970 [Candidatus Lindowbacteria bacterium RIFCSPLOWO2_12_FULL_62_27]|nr:MAG: hypothetical protein A3G34_03970 [Candidatus Lindowbacteria bacterium RIFCSPLOWO2_12_FULL_62_27]OGH63613.1 MAG: hypothetical protein A3I06_14120 [Candidatus Lindowbacteria bacterium RIFCSPLOWO2_02_FULL_62_12]
MITALVVDDESGIRTVVGKLLADMGLEVLQAKNGVEAKSCMDADQPELVLLDLNMPEKDGMALLREYGGRLPSTVVVLTAHGTVSDAVESMKLGAFDFLEKPFDAEQMKSVVQKALAQSRASEGDARPTPGGILGESPAIRKLIADIRKVGPTDATVLIVGETGTGKELAARAIHETSKRPAGPFVAVNCAALPETLVESELFGHEKGAFTGATTARPGKFEVAAGGTLFLDEVAELPAPAQAKLLRAVQERKITRLGAVSERPVDLRLVVATHRDLKQEMSSGRFREDLYYRLSAVTLSIPPLRDRAADIRLLADNFLKQHAAKLRRKLTWTGEALDVLERRSWPGNIRELQNVVESAAIFAETDAIGPDAVRDDSAGLPPSDLSGRRQEAELAAIREALQIEKGNVTRAATRLGLTRRGLQLKLKKLTITPRDFS